MAEARGIGIRSPLRSLARLFFLFILPFFFLAACSLQNLKEGESLADTSKGLLVGTVEWRQGGRPVESKSRFQLNNLQWKRRTYIHNLEGSDFRIPLAPGKYSFTSITAFNPEINKTTGRKAANVGLVFVNLLNFVTAPFYFALIPIIDSVSFLYPENAFEIKEHEVTYVGKIIIDLEDPLPAGTAKPQIRVVDEEDRIAADLQTIGGIEGIEKRLLPEVTPQVDADSLTVKTEKVSDL
ncbi:MAG: hypothetical protein MCM46_03620 [Candidatus Manganitrophus sp. SB1]|nr:hypothetical protein [Candidatus Manganitrophus morganii]